MPQGVLIVLEGPEGAGKSTQVRLIGDWMTSHGRPVVLVREPGGTAIGNEIRQLLLDPASDIVPRAEALLYMASRAQLVEQVIRPALADGSVVIMDRYFLATYAYQGDGRGLSEDALAAANRIATNGLVPDHTMLLMLPVEQGMSRVTQRGDWDRMERVELAFHERVSRAFTRFATPEWQRAHQECGPIEIVDAAGTERVVLDRILRSLHRRWPELIPAPQAIPEPTRA